MVKRTDINTATKRNNIKKRKKQKKTIKIQIHRAGKTATLACNASLTAESQSASILRRIVNVNVQQNCKLSIYDSANGARCFSSAVERHTGDRSYDGLSNL